MTIRDIKGKRTDKRKAQFSGRTIVFFNNDSWLGHFSWGGGKNS